MSNGHNAHWLHSGVLARARSASWLVGSEGQGRDRDRRIGNVQWAGRGRKE